MGYVSLMCSATHYTGVSQRRADTTVRQFLRHEAAQALGLPEAERRGRRTRSASRLLRLEAAALDKSLNDGDMDVAA